MHIGLCYDLRDDYIAAGYSELETAEFDRLDTIDALADALQRLGHRVERIGNVRALTRKLVAGARYDLVFNIAEGMRGYGREAQVPAILDAYELPYTFSDPLSCALTLHKAMAKRVIRDSGLPTPDFAVVTQVGDLDGVQLDYPLFAKPVAEGTGKGVDGRSRINDPAELREVCQTLLARHRQPVLVERYLPGREFTAAIVGSGEEARCIGIMEIVLRSSDDADAYGYLNKEECETRVEYRLLEEPLLERVIEEVALGSWRALLCADAGRVDLRCDANGRPNFIEINPLAGLHPEHSDLPIICNLKGIEYDHLIECIVESACRRYGIGGERPAVVDAAV
ncbi:MAG: D-alanine--D-alanine ligase [Gammaproteobacteria bacterium]|nr:D-alanine--D-alanine ligase [Gammaproteobacteria bacterium]